MPHRLSSDVLIKIVQAQGDIAEVGLSLEQVMEIICRHAQDLTGADSGIVEMPDGDFMVYRAATGNAGQHLGLRLAMKGSMSGLCLTTGQILICKDVEKDPRVDKEACRRVGVHSMVCVPLINKKRNVGVLKVMASRTNAFDETTATVLQILSGLIAGSMRTAELFLEKEELLQKTERLALVDELTGLANRRAGEDALRKEMAVNRRQNIPVSIVYLDIDFFKQVNDKRGHAGGDDVLRILGYLLKESVRESDTAIRWGGEEFMVVLANTPLSGAVCFAERLRALVAVNQMMITVSLGVAQCDRREMMTDFVDRADKLLYRSKTEGRNRVTS